MKWRNFWDLNLLSFRQQVNRSAAEMPGPVTPCFDLPDPLTGHIKLLAALPPLALILACRPKNRSIRWDEPAAA